MSFGQNIKISIFAILFRLLYSSCRWHISGIENLDEIRENNKSAILAYWHGNMLIPYYKFAKYKFHILAGFHKDANLGVAIGEKLGWNFFRGSSSKKGSDVFQELVDFLNIPGNVFVITPDGPKGPAKIPKPGTVRAAQKTGVPIIPIAGYSQKSWGFTNWDTFHVSKPFTKIKLKIGKPLIFTEDNDFKTCNKKLTDILNQLEQDAKRALDLK